jgi:hypothetical protein
MGVKCGSEEANIAMQALVKHHAIGRLSMNPELESPIENAPERKPIEKADGVTVAERYLGRLCEKSFLSLWSYPSLFRNQGNQQNAGHGKEICDLLVVFGQHIIIFSDKHCQFQNAGNVELNWRRWFRKAIQKSAEQAWGAKRWIQENPARIFLDRECKQPLPINLPPPETALFHLVVVAHGISKCIKQLFPGSSGSLMIDTGIKGFDKHLFPFYVGDLEPQKSFVHIFDDDSLQTLMATRDTVSDFVAYLSKREGLFRGKRTIRATGEEQLLAIYLKNLNKDNEHDFVFPIALGQVIDKIFIPEGHWEDFQKSPERIAQLTADKSSYAWDRLIEKFNYYALQQKQYFVSSGGIKDTEQALRFMAREPRWKRRGLAQSLVEMLKTTPENMRRLRMLPQIEKGDPHYVFLLLPHPSSFTYEQYRTARRNFLEGCCLAARLEYPTATDIIGIATESGSNRQDGRSEDIIYSDVREWNQDLENHARELKEKFGIFKKPQQFGFHLEEYPGAAVASTKMKNPRNKPCPCGSGEKYKHCCLNKKD